MSTAGTLPDLPPTYFAPNATHTEGVLAEIGVQELKDVYTEGHMRLGDEESAKKWEDLFTSFKNGMLGEEYKTYIEARIDDGEDADYYRYAPHRVIDSIQDTFGLEYDETLDVLAGIINRKRSGELRWPKAKKE
jgi:hypothetical protein